MQEEKWKFAEARMVFGKKKTSSLSTVSVLFYIFDNDRPDIWWLAAHFKPNNFFKIKTCFFHPNWWDFQMKKAAQLIFPFFQVLIFINKPF